MIIADVNFKFYSFISTFISTFHRDALYTTSYYRFDKQNNRYADNDHPNVYFHVALRLTSFKRDSRKRRRTPLRYLLFHTPVSIRSPNLLLFASDTGNSSFEINPRSYIITILTRGLRLFLVIRSFNENQKYRSRKIYLYTSCFLHKELMAKTKVGL